MADGSPVREEEVGAVVPLFVAASLLKPEDTIIIIRNPQNRISKYYGLGV